MKKVFLVSLLVLSSAGFANCDLKAENLVKKVIKQKLTVSSKDNLKYYEPEIDGKKYSYQVFEDHKTHTVNRAFLVLDMKTGTVYKENIASDSLDKIYKDSKSICK